MERHRFNCFQLRVIALKSPNLILFFRIDWKMAAATDRPHLTPTNVVLRSGKYPNIRDWINAFGWSIHFKTQIRPFLFYILRIRRKTALIICIWFTCTLTPFVFVNVNRLTCSVSCVDGCFVKPNSSSTIRTFSILFSSQCRRQHNVK